MFVESVTRRLSSSSWFLPAREGEELARLIRSVLDEYRGEKPYHSEVVQGLLATLLLLAARLFEGEAEPVQEIHTGLRQIVPAMEYINRFFMNPISIQEMAAQCSLSEAHLRRKFKEYLNMSPNEYLTAVRIRHSCSLLSTTNYSMMEVALQVGYQSVSSFDRNFQRLMGNTPYQYKKTSKDYKGKLLDYRISARKGWKTKEDM